MATYDYTDDQAFGLEMITEYGRLVKIQKFTKSAANPTKPWEGRPPAGLVEDEHDVMMAFVPPSSATALGLRGVDEGLLKQFEQIVICPHAPDFPADLREYDMILDLGTKWRILWSETLRPGPVNVLYFFGVAR